ncbi:MAG: hypothetical protein DHS20C13_03440 [Thermodesulfobacteriota bacterium]|nr:MAG: hypothetical protein DHS20C13_03440 [Thermodesulfobacteriota bacterium]
MKSLVRLFLVLTLFVVSALPAMAQLKIYGIGTESQIKELPPEEVVEPRLSPFLDSVLYSINLNTGTPTEIGTINGYTRCTGLDIHPDTGEFFAVCEKIEENGVDPILLTRNGLFNSYLLILDPNTGQATEIGSLELGRGDFVSDISFRSDGTLFAHLNGEGNALEAENTTNTVSANSLAIINTQTGNLTVLGPTGSDDTWSAIGFNGMDTLFQCTDNRNTPGAINILNQTTGNATFIDNLIYPPEFIIGDNIIGSKDFDGIGDFFAVLAHLGNGIGPEATTNGIENGNFLVTIDQFNGDIDVIGFIADETNQFAALVVRGEQLVAEVPTLSEYGLIATVVMLLGVAVVFLRRRQAKLEI